MNVNFNNNSWHRKLYSSTFFTKVPTNLCPYFWSVLSAIFLLPLTWVSFVVEKIRAIGFECENFAHRILLTVPLYVYIVAGYLASLILENIFNIVYFWWSGAPVGMAGIASIVFVVAYAVRFGKYVKDDLMYEYLVARQERGVQERRFARQMKAKELPATGFFVAFIGASYKKMCPRIEWNKKD